MCVLHAEGKEFDVDAFLSKSSFSPIKVWRKGEPTRKNTDNTCEDSGFTVDVSDADWNDFSSQISDAEQFLKNYHDELNQLSELSTVDDIRLDFPYNLRLNETFFTQSEYLPPSFLKAIAQFNIGVEMSLYPPGDQDEE